MLTPCAHPVTATGRPPVLRWRDTAAGFGPAWIAVFLLLLCTLPARAQAIAALPIAEALSLARTQASVPTGARVEVVAGQLDPRLRLAPCNQIQAYLPAGARPWGQTRVGLRCTAGPVAWNVYLPVTVKVWAQAVVTASALSSDAVLTPADLRMTEVDLAEQASPAYTAIPELIGRRLARAAAPGTTLRADSLRLRQWFGAGDTVSVTSQGAGFAVSGEAQALSPGLEGQPVRLRTESGRILSAWPVGERRAEVRM